MRVVPSWSHGAPWRCTRGRLPAKRGEDRLGRTLVAQSPRVEHEVVAAWIAPIRSVVPSHVRGTGRVGLMQAATRLLLGECVAGHDLADPAGLRRAQEDVEDAAPIGGDEGAAAADHTR